MEKFEKVIAQVLSFWGITLNPQDFRTYLKTLIKEAVSELLLTSQDLMPQKDAQKLYSIADLCKQFDVSRQTINSWKRSGKLCYRKLGGRIYFSEADVQKAIPQIDFSKWRGFQK